MKATDLMLGDWVLCDGKPYQVAEISAGLLCIDAERELFADPEDVEPIPLTAEILKKNGFVEHRDGFYATEQEQLAGDGFVVKNMVYYKSGTLSVVTERGEIGIGIKFIHQLQHALRPCGIEKEIVL